MNFENFFHQIFLNSYLCSYVCSQCHQSSSAAFSEWLPKQWCVLLTISLPSHAEIRRRDDVSGSIAGVEGKQLEVQCS